MITDLKIGASFPTDHPLHVGAPGILLPDADGLAALAEADVILSLDWVDLAGTLKAAKAERSVVISVSLDHHLHNGWSMDHQGLPPVDMFIAGRSGRRRCRRCRAVGPPHKAAPARPRRAGPTRRSLPATVAHGRASRLCAARRRRRRSRARSPICRCRGTAPGGRSAIRSIFSARDGGGGVGGGPGHLGRGRARAARARGRLPVAICGDGDYLMGVTALWTAAHYRIPLLMVIANNRSFFNDELHQERVARMRNRPVENRWIGQRISDPDIDLAAMARAQGAQGFGPVTRRTAELAAASARRSRRSKAARSRWSMCGSNRAMLPP